MSSLPPDYDPTAWDEASACYWVGYADGQAALIAGMEAWAAEFANSAPGAVAMPLPERHAAIVRNLVDRLVREGRRTR